MPRTIAAAVAMLVALILAVGASAAPAAAEDEVRWAVVPASGDAPDGRRWIEKQVDPGGAYTEHLAVTNLGDVPLTFALTAADGYFTDTGRFTMRTTDKPSVDAGLWLSVPESVSVAAGATAVVPFTITVPADATPGDHAGAVAASVFSQGTGTDGNSIGVVSRVGFRVMLTVSGTAVADLSLTDHEVTFAPGANPFGPGTITASYTLANGGNVWVSAAAGARAQGQATTAGTAVEMLQGETQHTSIALPGIWALGPIEVTLVATATPKAAEAESVAVTQKVTVWAIPWAWLAVLVLVVLLIVALLMGRASAKRRMQRRLDEAREEGARQAREADAS